VRFWDSSALVALILPEPASQTLEALLTEDREVIIWWGTPVECQSALYRRQREGLLQERDSKPAFRRLDYVLADADRVPPMNEVLERASRVPAIHPLRAADAFQLGAALAWCKGTASGRIFVCLDDRLRTAAQAEGFTVLPSA
jgi:hypothetical protein